MRYISTRGDAPEISFEDALLGGLAPDGGLYVPKSWPKFEVDEIRAMRGLPYTEIAQRVMTPFIGAAIEPANFAAMIKEAYAGFHHEAVTPLVQLGPNFWLLELFHGPTLAFKDVAMQLLGRLLDHVLEARGKRLTIVGATSGDTGGAAFSAFRSCARIDIFFMFPNGRVSDFQRKQMTMTGAKNCHAIAIEGSFDDCQNLVKALFANQSFADEVSLSAVNSINWGRIMAQLVYYFAAATALGGPNQKVSFAVPTGNFGDIYAGFVAKQMGLPVHRLVIATNENDILARTLHSGEHSLGEVRPTITPSMDIQISSNFERLLFEASGRDHVQITDLMHELKARNAYALPPDMLTYIREHFDARAISGAETLEEIRRLYEENGCLADPHSAVGLRAARDHLGAKTPMVALGTAHPAKFPEAVKKASGVEPSPPHWYDANRGGDEEFSVMKPDQRELESYILNTLKNTLK